MLLLSVEKVLQLVFAIGEGHSVLFLGASLPRALQERLQVVGEDVSDIEVADRVSRGFGGFYHDPGNRLDSALIDKMIVVGSDLSQLR